MIPIAIDPDKWTDFRIEDIFGSIERAKRRTINEYQPGETPYVTNSAFNNGVSGHLMPKSETDIEKGQCISVNTVDGSVFWQEEDFLANSSGNGLLLLRKKDLTPLSALFLCAAIRNSLDPNFAVMLTLGAVKKSKIKLPVDSSGSPDWAYMERMMLSVVEAQESRLSRIDGFASTEPTPVDVSPWGNFRIDQIFNIVKGSRLRSTDRTPGNIPYVGASQFNNGITHFIGNDEHIHPGGVLTVCYDGPVGTTFYQPKPCWVTDSVNILYPRKELPAEVLLFIAPIIQRVGSNFNYNDKWKLADMKAANIKLPVDTSGNPDWDYMESTMKALLDKKAADLNVLEQLLPQSEEPEAV